MRKYQGSRRSLMKFLVGFYEGKLSKDEVGAISKELTNDLKIAVTHQYSFSSSQSLSH